MKRETEKPLDEQRPTVAYLDGLQVKVNALRELQSASGTLRRLHPFLGRTLMPSILDKKFQNKNRK